MGFASVQDVVRTFPAHFADAKELIAYNMAWGWDEREVSEMTPDHRRAFEEELAERVRDRTGPSGFDETWTVHFTVARA